HVGKNGILHLQVPAEFNDMDVQITLALKETHQNGVAKLLNQNQVQEKSVESQLTNEELEALAQANGWPPGFLEATFGCLPDFPEIDFEGDYEKRDDLP
ncbi:MAG: hypothetical protein AAB401_16155, partial [Acidobacteriota bacterium]